MSTLPLKWLLHPQTSNLKWWQSTLPVGQSGNLGTNLDSAPSYAYPIQQQFLLGRLSIYIRSVTTSPHLHYQHLGLSCCHLTWIITWITLPDSTSALYSLFSALQPDWYLWNIRRCCFSILYLPTAFHFIFYHFFKNQSEMYVTQNLPF